MSINDISFKKPEDVDLADAMRSAKRRVHEGTSSLSADIAVAIAGIARDDYWGTLRAIDGVLEKYGVSQKQSVMGG